MEKPRKIQHSKDCLYVIEPRYYNNPAKEKHCNCGAVDFNDAIELYEPYHKQEIDKLTEEVERLKEENKTFPEKEEMSIMFENAILKMQKCYQCEKDDLKQQITKLTQELKNKEDANIQLIGELNKLRVEGQEELQEAIGCHKQEMDLLRGKIKELEGEK